MRVIVAVTGPTTVGWQVSMTVDDTALAHHEIAAVGGPPGIGPVAPNVPAPDLPHSHLTTADGAAERAKIAERLARCSPDPGDVEKMGRYLFDTLIGSTAWCAVKSEGAGRHDGSIELALAWKQEGRPLDRLNWELMHDGEGFLAGHPALDVAITRLVLGADAPEPRAVKAPVRVLFVIGSHLSDPRIRAGAEIMGLMRRVERGEGTTIDARVSEWTTLPSLEAAVRRHRPHVVHFVTHGEVSEGRGRLELRREGASPEREDSVQLVDADALLLALRDQDKRLPPLAVVTACESGGGLGDHTAPLAAELVAGGIPAVVGMTGRVSDMACRLFTERFGWVLTNGGSLIAAVSAGRRAALRETSGPGDGMNWALPALFLAESVKTDFAPVDTSGAEAVVEHLRRFKLDDDPVFCGRREHLRLFDQLLDPADSLTVLASYTERPTGGVGKTRLMQEFGRRALRDGHIIVFLRESPAVEPPKNAGQLAARLLEQINRTRKKLGLAIDLDSVLLDALAEAAGEDLNLAGAPEGARSSRLSRFLSNHTADLDLATLRDALVPDLATLARDAGASGHPGIAAEPRVVLLLEGVQRWNVPLLPLFELFHDLSDETLVPVAVTCSLADVNDDLEEVRRKTLNTPDTARFIPLEPFSGDDESLAYQWVLLNPRPQLVPGVSDKIYAVKDPESDWLTDYHGFINGLPAKIDDVLFYAVTQGLARGTDNLLIRGDDEDVLKRWITERQP